MLSSTGAQVLFFSLKVQKQNVRNPSSPVVMDAVFLYSGNVMVMKTVQMAVMKVLVVSSQAAVIPLWLYSVVCSRG